MTTVFNQDLIPTDTGVTYNPDFLNDATTTEDDPDREIVLRGIDQIAEIFSSVHVVRSSHKTVQSVLSHAGYETWEDFLEDYSEEVEAAFTIQDTANKPATTEQSLANAPNLPRKGGDLAFLTAYGNAAKKLLDNLTKDRETINKEIDELDNEIVTTISKIKQITERLAEIAPIRANATKSDECVRLEALHEKLKNRLPALQRERNIQIKKIDAILAQSDSVTQQLMLINDDSVNQVIQISSGDFATDADAYSCLAKNCCFRIGYALHALTTMRTRQWRENSEPGTRYSIREMMDTGGGVYESDSLETRISKAEAEINRLVQIYAAATIQYHLLSSYPRDPNAFWPKHEDNFWESICISRQRAIIGTNKKREAIRAAEEQMAERGAWRGPKA